MQLGVARRHGCRFQTCSDQHLEAGSKGIQSDLLRQFIITDFDLQV